MNTSRIASITVRSTAVGAHWRVGGKNSGGGQIFFQPRKQKYLDDFVAYATDYQVVASILFIPPSKIFKQTLVGHRRK